MKKFQVNFIEVHTVNIGGVEKDILAFQVATINEISKKQIIDNYYNKEDNQDFLDRLNFEKINYPDYPNLVTDILDVHSRAIVSIQEIGDMEINKKDIIKAVQTEKQNLLGKSCEFIKSNIYGLAISVKSKDYYTKKETTIKEDEILLIEVFGLRTLEDINLDLVLLSFEIKLAS